METIKAFCLSFPINGLDECSIPSTPNNVHTNKEVNLTLMYRKMGIRYLLLFMASDISGKIILMKKTNVTCGGGSRIFLRRRCTTKE